MKPFSRLVAMYPVGSYVTLSNGERGVVTGVSPKNPYRPTVRILADKEGRTLDRPFDRDLLERPVLAVIDIQEPDPTQWQTAYS